MPAYHKILNENQWKDLTIVICTKVMLFDGIIDLEFVNKVY